MKRFFLVSLLCASALTFAPEVQAKIVELTNVNEVNSLISKGNVVIDFYATWCGPCKALSPILNSLAAEHPQVTFVKINGDQFAQLGAQFGINAYPTLIFLKNGVRVEVARGGRSKQDLKKMLNTLFA